jgi:glutamyl-tRNA reductase
VRGNGLPPQLLTIGLSHHTAPLGVRERFVCEGAAAAGLMEGVAAHGGSEVVLLSTCNRTELYLATADAAASERLVTAVLAAHAGLPEPEARRYLYVRHDLDAVRHLFRVAAGLDSLVVGEAQIQGQVRLALEQSAGAPARFSGPVLGRLFDTALCTGGRVRAETGLGRGAASVPSAAVELARKIFGRLRGRRVLVVGAGEMSELALQCLQNEGVEHVVVASRTLERARSVTERAGGTAATVERLPELLAEADILLTATTAPHPVVRRSALEPAIAGRREPLLVLDIALPRDVEPDVAELDNVFLYDLDDLRVVVESNLDRRRSEIADAERIVAESVADFDRWRRARGVAPVIRAMRGRAERVRRAEVERALRSLQHLGPEDRAAVEALTRQILAKLLHPPTARLREAAELGREAEIAALTRYLFRLEEEDAADGSPDLPASDAAAETSLARADEQT